MNELSIGERVWAPVSNGMVFVDGRYIPPPYVISRKEDWIFANGHKITWTIPWPPKKKIPPPPPPKEMPVMPSSITTNTTPYDKDYIDYVGYASQYLIAKYGTKEGIKIMVNVYKKLPCIKEARLNNDTPEVIDIVWTDGGKGGVRLTPFPGAELNITKEQAAKFIDHVAEIYVRGLSAGDYYMVEGCGPSRTGLKAGISGFFQPVADTMRAATNETEFLVLMKARQPSGGMSEKTLRSFYKHKDELSRWEQRLQEKK